MNIRLITDKDYKAVAEMIARSVSSPNYANFYPQKSIDSVKNALNEDGVKKRASWTHFYVIEEDEKIVACGAIGPYWGSLTESSLFSIFVDENYQGKGYGKKSVTIKRHVIFVISHSEWPLCVIRICLTNLNAKAYTA